eukprot:5467763-Pyramimonas_sp.AAC.1
MTQATSIDTAPKAMPSKRYVPIQADTKRPVGGLSLGTPRHGRHDTTRPDNHCEPLAVGAIPQFPQGPLRGSCCATEDPKQPGANGRIGSWPRRTGCDKTSERTTPPPF